MGYKTNNLWPVLCIGNLLILFASTLKVNLNIEAPTITCGQTTFIRIEGWTSERKASSRDASLAEALYPNAHSLLLNLKVSSPQERLGFCIPRGAFRIPVFVRGTFGFWIPIVNGLLWDFGFAELYSGFQTPWFRIPQAKFSRIPDSISKKVPDSRMEIPLHGVSKRSISTKLRENRELYSLRETMDSVSPGSVIPRWEEVYKFFLAKRDKKNLDRWERGELFRYISISTRQTLARLFCGRISG